MIFARLQYENGSMDEAEYETYLDLHENMMEELNDLYKQQVLFKKSPDLMVMVHGSFEEVMRRIKRAAETSNRLKAIRDFISIIRIFIICMRMNLLLSTTAKTFLLFTSSTLIRWIYSIRKMFRLLLKESKKH